MYILGDRKYYLMRVLLTRWYSESFTLLIVPKYQEVKQDSRTSCLLGESLRVIYSFIRLGESVRRRETAVPMVTRAIDTLVWF